MLWNIHVIPQFRKKVNIRKGEKVSIVLLYFLIGISIDFGK